MVPDRAYVRQKSKIIKTNCFKKKPFAVYIRVPKALGIFFGGALVDGTEVFRLKKNGFIDGSPENGNPYRGSN